MSGHPVEPLYTAGGRSAEARGRIGRPGEYPFTRGPYESMYRGRLWTMRQFAGFGTVEETNERFHYLLDHGQTGLSTAFDMPTLMGYDSDHARSLGEVGREGVAVDSLDDMEQLFDGHPAGRGHHLDDDQRPGRDPARLLRPRRRAAGRAAGEARRHDPDRHPQGVHRPEGVVLPDRAGDAAGHRHDRVVLAEHAALAPGLDLRLPHPRGRLDRPAGARLHAQGRLHLRRAGARARPRRRRLRPPALLLLQRPHRLLRGDRQVPGGAPDLGARDEGDLRRQARGVDAAALPRADRRRLADRPAAAQQRRPHLAGGAGGGARRHPVAAHQLLRRGAGAADRGGGAGGAAHPADHRLGVRVRRTRRTRSAAPGSSRS